MPRRPKDTDEPATPLEEFVVDQEVKEEIDAIRTLQTFVSQFPGQGWKVEINRRNPVTNRYAFVRQIPFETFSQDMVRRGWGGGSYQARAVDQKGIYRKTVQFEIDESEKPDAPRGEDRATRSNGPDDGRMWELLLLMFQQSAEAARLQSAQTTSILTAMIGAKADPVELAAKLAELVKGGGGGGVSDMKALIDLYKDGLQDGRDTAGGGGGLGGAIRDLVPPVLGLIADSQRTHAAQPVPATNLPAIVPAPPQPEAPAVTVPAWYQYARAFFPMMIDSASKGLDPAGLVRFLGPQLPDGVTDSLVADMDAGPDLDGWITRTLGILPPQLAQRFPDWTRRLLLALADELTEPDEPTSPGIPEDEQPPAEGGEA